MTPSVQARVGDTVRANFNLVYKHAEVEKLPDRKLFRDYGFTLECDRHDGGVKTLGVPRGFTTGPIRCPDNGLGDDMPVEVEFVFDDVEVFRANQVWTLGLVYYAKFEHTFVFGPEPHPRRHVLGLVQLIG